MSRPIKFRAWDKKEAEMINWDWFIGKDQFHLGTLRDLFEPDLIPMQFTGLHDKNGKEIYEGDIVLITGSYYGDYKVPVSFIHGAFGYKEIDAKQVTNPKGWDKPHDAVETNGFHITGSKAFWERVRFNDIKKPEQYEVIGNIYENGDLLNAN